MRAVGIYIAIAAGIYMFSSAWQANRDSTGTIVSQGSVDAFQMQVGDCFNDTDTSYGEGELEVSTVPGVPCAEPHDNEVFAVFKVAAEHFPGEAMADMAFDGCVERFEPFVGRDYMSSALDVVTLYPSRESWHRKNDREVVCAVFDLNLEKLVGSVAGLGL